MSISRRGLLAAGLAAAVVGSIGVVSIISANAEDTAQSTVVSQDGSTDQSTQLADQSGATPPALLPWGERPVKVKQAPAGTSGREVQALGADIAPADDSGDTTPQAEWAPKGRSTGSGSLREETTSIQPPLPPATGALSDIDPVTINPVNYYYGVGSQIADSSGAYANVVIGKPYLAPGDYHSLAEISIQSSDGQQIVEVGWTVDRTVNGDSDPHLFVYHWVNGQGSCYNACGWRQYSVTTQPGYTLPVGAAKLFGVQHANGAWWVAYDTEWIGYFPDSLWNWQFSHAGVQQFFGEVATSTGLPCSQMGTGSSAFTDTSARFGSIGLINGPAAQVITREIGGVYNVNQLSDRTFRYGGPGGC